MTSAAPSKHQLDTRHAQAARVADYLELHPASTQKEIDAVADTGCVSKVLSEMPRLYYRITKAWREVPCTTGNRRRVRTYTLTQRPGAQPDLFTTP
jgi:hypothetical protein